tara:strand:+ start:289 stop:501 length:213 start_codon:yes stop_codon:yes gene_type:complete
MKDKVYHELLGHVLKLLVEKHSLEMVAGCMMAIAQRLYKTHLSEEDYQAIMRVAQKTKVKPYDLKKGTVH